MNGDELAIQREPDEPIDPNFAEILSLLSAVAVPVLSVLTPIIIPEVLLYFRQQEQDLRTARQILSRIEAELVEAENLLRWANEFILRHSFNHNPLWPAGANGIDLSPEAYDHYQALIERACVLLQRLDDESGRLADYTQKIYPTAGMPALTIQQLQWQQDLHQAKEVQKQVLTAHTFGERSRHLKLSIKMCREVVETLNRWLGEPQAPATGQARRVP